MLVTGFGSSVQNVSITVLFFAKVTFFVAQYVTLAACWCRGDKLQFRAASADTSQYVAILEQLHGISRKACVGLTLLDPTYEPVLVQEQALIHMWMNG